MDRRAPTANDPYMRTVRSHAAAVAPGFVWRDPGTRRKPDQLYRRVAEVYLEQPTIRRNDPEPPPPQPDIQEGTHF